VPFNGGNNGSRHSQADSFDIGRDEQRAANVVSAIELTLVSTTAFPLKLHGASRA
jgi:hypothetical protein